MTARLRVLSPLTALALMGCGGSGPVDAGPPTDIRLDQANQAGTQALTMASMSSLASEGAAGGFHNIPCN